MRTYRELFALPGVLRLLLSATFPRLAYSMVGLSVFFHLQAMTGSVGTAGLALGAMSLMGSLTAAPRGAFVDRFGQTVPLYVMTPAYAVSAFLMARYASSSVSALAFAMLLGVAAPPVNMSIRPLWVEIVGQERVRTAYGLDSAHMNIMQLLGPVLATLAALHIGSAAGLYVVAGCMAAGGVLLATNPNSKAWVPEEKVEGEVGLLKSPAMRLLALEGHTGGDLAIYDENSGVLFTGDLVFNSRAPTTPHAQLKLWLASLDVLEAVTREPGFTALVPGHGAVTRDAAPIRQTRAWLNWLNKTMQEAAAAGLDMNEVLAQPLPAEFAGMALGKREFDRSVGHLFPTAEQEALGHAH